jgi:hypothetical protein
MNSERKAAMWIGALFIIGTVAGALSLVVTNPLLTAPDYVAQVAAHPGQMVLGTLLVLTMGFALAMVPVVFWPVGKKHNEMLAMGYVVFRGALETVTYIVGGLGWLLLVALSKESGAGPLAGFVRTTERLIWDQLIAIPFILGALMFYYLLYQSRLVPRWLSVWGLAGAVVYIIAPLANMFGFSVGFLMAPLAIQEMVMAVWLIARGFSSPVPQRSLGRPTQPAQSAVGG